VQLIVLDLYDVPSAKYYSFIRHISLSLKPSGSITSCQSQHDVNRVSICRTVALCSTLYLCDLFL